MARLNLNLARRPFVNERPLVWATAAVALLVMAASFANFYGLLGAWAESRQLRAEIVALREEADQARKEEKRLVSERSEAERKRLRTVSSTLAAIVEKRRLSWSHLLDQFEAVLPRDVRVLTVLPDVRDGKIALVLDCVARDNEAKLKFYRKLYEAPFSEAYILSETNEAGAIRFNLRCYYDPNGPLATPIYEPMPWERAASPAGHPDGAGAAAAGGSMSPTGQVSR